MIYHFDFKTPGREEDSGTDDVSAAIIVLQAKPTSFKRGM